MPLAFKVGLRQRRSEKNGQKGRVRRQLVPSLVPMPAQTAAKMQDSPPTAAECSAETDSALEGARFEPSVPRKAPRRRLGVESRSRRLFRSRGSANPHF